MNHSAQDKPTHDHRTHATQLFNDTWTLMDLETRTSEQVDAKDWDLARAYCLHKNTELTQQYINQALSVAISEKENRELLESDIATICTRS